MPARLFKFSVPIALTTVLVLSAVLFLHMPAHAADECAAPGAASGCYATIQAAVDAAGNGDTVRVLTGTYNENLLITKSVTLLGGCGGPACNSRTPGASTIDGMDASTVISVTQGAAPTIDGFTITGGNATTNGGRGGGINVWEASAIIQNNTIEGNVASSDPALRGRGGGVYVYSTTTPIQIQDNTIRNNAAYSALLSDPANSEYGLGGGVCLAYDTVGVVQGNTFTSNVAATTQPLGDNTFGAGGAIGLQGVIDVVVSDNIVTGNTANKGSGNGQGGGLASWEGEKLAVEGNKFVGNVSLESGQGGFGGGIYAWETKLVTVTNSLVQGNKAAASGVGGQGGGIHVALDRPASAQASVQDGAGGEADELYRGLQTAHGFVSGAHFVIKGNTVISNTAVANQTSIGYIGGGGMRLWAADQSLNATLILEDNTIAGNLGVTQIDDMSGYYQDGGGASIRYFANAEIRNNRVHDNTLIQQATAITDQPDGFAGSVKGGGMSISESGTVLFEGNLVERNVTVGRLRGGGSNPAACAGGVMFDNVVNNSVLSNTISSNVAILDGAPSPSSTWLNGHGGGMAATCYSAPNCRLRMDNNEIHDNRVAETFAGSGSSSTGLQGGGVYVNRIERVSAAENEFTGNAGAATFDATGSGGWGGDVQGGGFFIYIGDAVTLTNNIFDGNMGVEDLSVSNAGMYIAGGAIELSTIGDALLEDNVIRGNVLVDDGAVSGSNGENVSFVSGGMDSTCGTTCAVDLRRNRFVDNRVIREYASQGNVEAYFVGAAYNVNRLTCNTDSNRILRNRNHPDRPYGQAVVNVWQATLNSINDVYAFNSSALFVGTDDAAATPANLAVMNGTLCNNGTRGVDTGGGMATVKNTIIVGHDEGLFAGNPGSITGDYNLLDNTLDYVNVTPGARDLVGEKPQLANPNNGNFHLRAGSPAIDRGTNSGAPDHDFDGDVRPIDGDLNGSWIVDIGADEFDSSGLAELPVQGFLPAAIKDQ